MANRTRDPRKGAIYTITGGLLAFGFLMMAFYDTGVVAPKAVAAVAPR